jgi:tripartite-type tricarboxylate transporter receptor subunit TctC
MQVLNPRWKNTLRRACGATAMAVMACAAHAQTYPSKPVTLIVPFPPGGASDTQFRALATAASKDLKQPFVVVNQPGVAGTMAPANMARSAAPDGYTISVISSSLFRVPHVQKVNYDATKDFTYIAGISKFIYGLVVATDSPYKTAQDLVAAAKAKPGEINVGAISTGSSGHIALMRWARAADFQPNYVP